MTHVQDFSADDVQRCKALADLESVGSSNPILNLGGSSSPRAFKATKLLSFVANVSPLCLVRIELRYRFLSKTIRY